MRVPARDGIGAIEQRHRFCSPRGGMTMTLPAATRPPVTPDPVRHIFSVDVEEYFQVNAFEAVVCRANWGDYASRIEASIDALLALLAEHEATATFFCLGWVAERHKAMIRRIAHAGHEIASHGWWHRRVTQISRAEFEWEVVASKQLLEDITGNEVIGYRAPSYSIVRGGEWALDVLLEQGYRYDSSLFPIYRNGYGYAGGRATPHMLLRGGGSLLELPPATLRIGPARIPAAGGGYLRQLPLGLIRAAVRQHASRGVPAMLYIHPWEIDPDQPRLPVGVLTRVRHYRGLARTMERLRRLVREFEFTSAVHYVSDWRGLGPALTAFAPSARASVRTS